MKQPTWTHVAKQRRCSFVLRNRWVGAGAIIHTFISYFIPVPTVTISVATDSLTYDEYTQHAENRDCRGNTGFCRRHCRRPAPCRTIPQSQKTTCHAPSHIKTPRREQICEQMRDDRISGEKYTSNIRVVGFTTSYNGGLYITIASHTPKSLFSSVSLPMFSFS